MKYAKYLFLILSIIFVFEIVNSNQADACIITDGVVNKDGAGDNIDNGCDETPALYKLLLHKELEFHHIHHQYNQHHHHFPLPQLHQ